MAALTRVMTGLERYGLIDCFEGVRLRCAGAKLTDIGLEVAQVLREYG